MNVQATTANKVNEITSITNSTGTAWATPTYDGAGNMIRIPKRQLDKHRRHRRMDSALLIGV